MRGLYAAGNAFEPTALGAAGSTYISKSSRAESLPAASRQCAAGTGTDVALKATVGDCPVGAVDVGVKAAEIAFPFTAAFAQCGNRAGLYHFEKVKPHRLASF